MFCLFDSLTANARLTLLLSAGRWLEPERGKHVVAAGGNVDGRETVDGPPMGKGEVRRLVRDRLRLLADEVVRRTWFVLFVDVVATILIPPTLDGPPLCLAYFEADIDDSSNVFFVDIIAYCPPPAWHFFCALEALRMSYHR